MKTNLFFLIVVLHLFYFLACTESPFENRTHHAFEWQVSTPEEQGFNSDVLSDAVSRARETGFMNSLLLVRHGYLVDEHYFNGYDKNDAHNVRSVTKSVMSALVGIAFREGIIDSLNQRVLSFFPEYNTPTLDPRKLEITIRHLLTMSAGFDHDSNIFFQIQSSPDWIEATINLPLIYNPGANFSYNTFEPHLLSAIITKVSGMSTLKFAQKYLLEPLKIEIRHWQEDPQGYFHGGANMFLTPRDMARFGYLYLNNGTLDGVQIVPEDWVGKSFQNSLGHNTSSWGELKNVNYGFLWWLGEIGGYSVRMALGHGGQYIINFPALDMIVVTTSYSDLDWDTADEHERAVLDIVANYIIPAMVQ